MYLLRMLPGPETVQTDHDVWKFIGGCVLLTLAVVIYTLEKLK